VTDRIPVPGQPGSVAAGAGAVWVASTLGGTIFRIDPGTDRVVQTVHVPGVATGALTLRGNTLWAANTTDDTLVALDAGTGARGGTYSMDFRPTAVAAAGSVVWVAGYDAGVVAELDPATGHTLLTIRVGNGPAAMVMAGRTGSGHGVLWVANSLDSTVSE